MANIYQEVQKNIIEWDQFVKKNIGVDASLISISQHDDNRRIYRLGNRIFKMQRNLTIQTRANDLKEEFGIIKKLHGVAGICQNPKYSEESGWKILSYDYTEGESLENLLLSKDYKREKIILKKIYRIILSINKKGIVHRDIKPSNIIVDKSSNVSIIDFDQSLKTSKTHAFLIDIFGIGTPNKNGYFCFANLVERYVSNKPLWSKPIFLSLKIIQKLSKINLYKKEKKITSSSDVDIKNLGEAWKIGEDAGANSPGNHVAYYSLDALGVHFPGERPWILRWSKIFNKVDFTGKRILECGCNLGLLSAFAKNAGAKECVGVDINSKILTGSNLVSKALHVKNTFFQVDFDSSEKWEEKLSGFDMVIALSVVNWLKNPDRFIAFLGKHKEILYEGHDPIPAEIEKLKQAGFKTIDLIFVSERNRATFYASK